MTHDLDLATLRSDIDTIDNEIVSLLKKRLHVVHQVGKIKANQPKQSFIRSGREATMIKQLVKQIDKQYPAETIIRMWRSIITASLYAEQPFNIAVEVNSMSRDNYWLAREYFGTFVPTSIHDRTEEVIHHIQNDPSFIGVVSPTGSWWDILSTGTGAPYGISVFACLPFVHSHTTPKQDLALSLAQVTPEKTGHDISLLVVQTTRSDALVALEAALQKLSLPLLDHQKNANKLLLYIDGYITNTTPALITSLQEMTGQYVTTILPMGCYAKQIHV